MKKQILIVTLASLFATTVAKDFDLSTKSRPTNGAMPMGQSPADSISHLVTPAFQNPLHAEDASLSSNPTIDITSSGRYYLAGEMAIAATTSGASLIQIDADNVQLDLNTKTISARSTATQTNLVGIKVNNRSNVAIMNGTVQCTDSAGTQRIVTGIDLGTVAATTFNVTVSDVLINQAMTNSIIGNAINNVKLSSVSCNNMSSSTTAVTGLSLTTCKNLSLSNCEFNNNATTFDGSGGDATGCLLSACSDGEVKNCVASINTTTTTSRDALSSGFDIQSDTKAIIFKSCQASSNRSNSRELGTESSLNFPSGSLGFDGSLMFDSVVGSVGFRINASNLNRFEDCSANGNGTSGSNGVNNTTAGFYIVNECDNCTFVRCEASRNISDTADTGIFADTVSNAAGFLVSTDTTTNNLLFTDCVANSNTAQSSNSANGVYGDDAAGFYLSGASDCKLINCEANKNTSTDGDAFGFRLRQANSDGNHNNSLVDCKSRGNTASNSNRSGYASYGFHLSDGRSNRLEKCVGNAQSSTTASAIAAGFLLNNEVRSAVVECEAVGNNAGSAGSDVSYGIRVTGASSANNSIRDSYVAYNVGTKAFGIYDDSGADNAQTTSLILSNVSAGHGTCLSPSTLSGSLVWNFNDEPTASQNFYFKHDGTGDDPSYMISEVPKLNLVSLSTSVKMWENVSIY